MNKPNQQSALHPLLPLHLPVSKKAERVQMEENDQEMEWMNEANYRGGLEKISSNNVTITIL